MTQLEAEALVRILKNRNAEEKTSIENVYNVDHRRTEEERNHSMRRIEQRIHTARLALASASDAKHKANLFKLQLMPSFDSGLATLAE